MLSSSQISNMLSLQNEMNATVNEKWLEAGYPFLRAVVIEGAEAIEHYGWKWWKAQQCDLPQVQLEIVDIFHFMLSHFILQSKGDLDQAERLFFDSAQQQANLTIDQQTYVYADMDLIEKFELTIALAALRKISISLLESMLKDAEMNWNDLFRQYIGKNTLNLFRQANGYKEGTYQKEWYGKEDNEHLVELMDALDPTSVDFISQLNESLSNRYPK